MTIDTLFGTEEISTKSRTIRFRTIKAVYETLTVREEMNRLLPSSSQYNDAELKVMALNAACDEYFSCLPEGLSYSDIYRELEGNGNISANPETDYRLYLTEQWSGIDSYELLRQIASTEYAIFMLLKKVRDGKC